MTLNDDAKRQANALKQLTPDIKKAGKFIAYQWPGIMEADDAGQAIYLRLLESPASVTKILEMEKRAQYRAIVGIGNQLASAERADYDHFKGSYRYSVGEVKSVLQRQILVVGHKAAQAEVALDLHAGLDQLRERNQSYWEAIHSRYQEDTTPASNSGAQALSRGLTALTDEMNKSNKRRHSERDDGVGTRQSLTIGQCQSALEFDWDGEGMEFEQ